VKSDVIKTFKIMNRKYYLDCELRF